MAKSIILIPSRLGATRLPNKPLLKINNKSIIMHVYEKAIECGIGDVFVTTCDEEIISEVQKNGGKSILTSKEHNTGTDRIAEALEKIKLENEVDYIINLQGDEPLIDISDIKDNDNFEGYTPTYNYSWEISSDNGETWTALTSTDATDNNNSYVISSHNVVIADSFNDFSNVQGENGWEYGYYQGCLLYTSPSPRDP